MKRQSCFILIFVAGLFLFIWIPLSPMQEAEPLQTEGALADELERVDSIRILGESKVCFASAGCYRLRDDGTVDLILPFHFQQSLGAFREAKHLQVECLNSREIQSFQIHAVYLQCTCLLNVGGNDASLRLFWKETIGMVS